MKMVIRGTHRFHIICEEHILQVGGDGVLRHVEVNLIETKYKEIKAETP